MLIIEPKTKEDFEKYYQLRWEILRKPWDKPRGSEKDENEDNSIHAMAVNDQEEVLGVCRLQFNSNEEAQIRFMAVRENIQGQGIGGLIINYIENKAIEKGTKYVMLHAREGAISFYKNNGYKMVKASYLMWGKIQHFQMKKVF